MRLHPGQCIGPMWSCWRVIHRCLITSEIPSIFIHISKIVLVRLMAHISLCMSPQTYAWGIEIEKTKYCKMFSRPAQWIWSSCIYYLVGKVVQPIAESSKAPRVRISLYLRGTITLLMPVMQTQIRYWFRIVGSGTIWRNGHLEGISEIHGLISIGSN